MVQHHARLDLEHQIVALKPIEQLDRDIQVVLECEIAAVEHVAVEQVRPPGCPATLCLLDERNHELIELARLAVIGDQRNIDGVSIRDPVHVLGDRRGAEGHVLDGRAGGECAATCRDLKDPVAPGLRKPAQDSVGGRQ